MKTKDYYTSNKFDLVHYGSLINALQHNRHNVLHSLSGKFHHFAKLLSTLLLRISNYRVLLWFSEVKL
jgi:hypothetical protein